MSNGEACVFAVWVTLFLLFWNFDTPEGVEYRFDVYDLIYKQMEPEYNE